MGLVRRERLLRLSGGAPMVSDAVRVWYLGPQGSFTHQAAMDAVPMVAARESVSPDAVVVLPCADVPEVLRRVRAGGYGVLAWDNTVEGAVMPNVDAMLDDDEVVGIGRVRVPVVFDAMMRADDEEGTIVRVSAHPHGLAQCTQFIRERGLSCMPAVSNAAACQTLPRGCMALGPSACAEVYGLRVVARAVQDYHAAATDFLVVVSRDVASRWCERSSDAERLWGSVVAMVPLHTGAGVLADMLDVVRDAGVNMTSFMSRPIKGHAGLYSFIATMDAAPWQPALHQVLRRVMAQGDWVKTLAVYEREPSAASEVDVALLPGGGVRGETDAYEGAGAAADVAGRALLW